jgi:hypothetical protein
MQAAARSRIRSFISTAQKKKKDAEFSFVAVRQKRDANSAAAVEINKCEFAQTSHTRARQPHVLRFFGSYADLLS